MKLLNGIKFRLSILKCNILYSLQQDLAYPTNNWSNIISATVYMVTTVLFINIVYANTREIAGYNKNEMLFLMLIGQISFLIVNIFSIGNIRDLVDSVNSGELDLILTKPLPSLFFVTFRNIFIYNVIRDFALGIIILIVNIRWEDLHLNTVNILAGIIILLAGMFSANAFHFIASLPVFWLRENGSVVDFTFYLQYDVFTNLPYEGFNFSKVIQLTFTVIVPFLIGAPLCATIMLGKLEPLIPLIVSLLVLTVSLFLKSYLWKVALRNYSSASS